MLLGGDFTGGHALCVSLMGFELRGLYEGHCFGANPLESRTWAGVL